MMIPLLPFLTLAALPALPLTHPTPVVVLVKQTDVLRATLPESARLFARDITLGRDDVMRIQQQAHFTPEDPDLRFYLGKGAGDRIEGVVLFAQTNTKHGPVEVGLTFAPDGRVTSAIVTKATVETKPWVLQALRSGLMDGFVSLRYGEDAGRALQTRTAADLGRMPRYMAEVIAATVERGIILHHLLYRQG